MQAKMYGDVGNKLGDFDLNLCVYVDYFNIDLLDFKLADVKVFVNIEPPEVHDISKLDAIVSKFDFILTWNKDLLSKYPEKAHFFEWGSCWIPEDQQTIHQKTKDVSIIASEKNYLDGHKLRHKVIKALGDKLDVYGRGYKFIETKTEALAPYRYSIIIENVKHHNYFTEKIIDCLRTGTVPIYWGSNNIDKFFNIKGFIMFKDEQELQSMYSKLNQETYNNMLPYIEENFNLALAFAIDYQKRLYEKILSIVKNKQLKRLGFIQKLKIVVKYYYRKIIKRF